MALESCRSGAGANKRGCLAAARRLQTYIFTSALPYSPFPTDIPTGTGQILAVLRFLNCPTGQEPARQDTDFENSILNSSDSGSMKNRHPDLRSGRQFLCAHGFSDIVPHSNKGHTLRLILAGQ